MNEAINAAIEKVVVGAVMGGFSKQLEACFAEHNMWGKGPPLQTAIEAMMLRKLPQIEKLLDKCVSEALDNAVFEQALRERVSQKLVNVILAKTESEFEKRVSELRSDAAFRAKITLAITGVLNEYKMAKTT